MSQKKEESVSYQIWATRSDTGKRVPVFTPDCDIRELRRHLWKMGLYEKDDPGFYKDVQVIKTHVEKITRWSQDKSFYVTSPITKEEAAQFEENEIWFDGGS